MDTFDVVVIGAGPGGYPAAIRAAQLGASVAIVEKERLGGTCLNWGCIPTKTLIAASSVFANIKHSAALGITVKDAAIDYAVMIDHKDNIVGTMRDGIKRLLTANGVKQFTGTASFKDRNTIVISGSVTIGAKKVIIATGSTSAKPGFLPKHERVVESRSFLEIKKLPENMIVLGGGFIGCELACMAAQLGVKVTVVELLQDILLLLDVDVRREVRSHMEKQLGIRIMTGAPLENIEADNNGVSARCGMETLKAGLLLSAVGRKPVTDGLELDKAGIKVNDRGFIEVDDYGRTRVATIFAIGDVTGKTQLAHYATAQGIVAAENACSDKPRKNETLVPNVIFTVPEVGIVGLSEDDAKKQNHAVTVGKYRFSGLGRAMAVNETYGFAKWIVDASTNRLIGAAVTGPHATELIAEATSAIRSELTAMELSRTIHAHPTFGEVWMEAACAVQGNAIHAVPKGKP
jgi:dihydrolipoamide dehydrogenase